MYSLAFKMEILRELNSEVIGCYTRYLVKNRDKDNSEIEKKCERLYEINRLIILANDIGKLEKYEKEILSYKEKCDEL